MPGTVLFATEGLSRWNGKRGRQKVIKLSLRLPLQRRGSRLPFHELPNVILTPHCSSATDGARDRRFGTVAGNIDRYVRGEPLMNVVMTT